MRHEILELVRRDAEVLAAIKAQLIRIEGKLDCVGNMVGGEPGLTKEIRCLDLTLQNLVRDLPKIVGDAVRNALPEEII
jgi:hypothetical protein